MNAQKEAWKSWILFAIFLVAAWWRSDHWRDGKVQLYRHLETWVQAKGDFSGLEGYVSHLFLEGRWLWVKPLKIRLRSRENCARVQKGWWVGQLVVQKPSWGWNAFPFRTWVDQLQVHFRCLGGVVNSDLTTPRRSLLGAVRQHLQATLKTRIAPGWGGDILYSLLTGDHHRISPQLRQYLQLSFVWHLCVVSGMHVVMIFGLLFWVWKWISFPLRSRWALVSVSVDVWIRWVIAAFFLGWWGCEPSSLRGLGFYFATYLWGSSAQWAQKFWRVGMVILVLISIDPTLCEAVGFWMSVYASLCFSLVSQNLKFQARLWQLCFTTLLMNICMVPWVMYLSGVILWPWLVLSPLALAQSIVAAGCGAIQSIFSGANVLQQGVEQFMKWSLEQSYQAPSVFYVTGFISKEVLWLFSAVGIGALVSGAFWFQRPFRGGASNSLS